MRALVEAGLVAVIFALGLVIGYTHSPHEVRLIGYGCLGASGPIYAAEESDFPQCLSIEEM